MHKLHLSHIAAVANEKASASSSPSSKASSSSATRKPPGKAKIRVSTDS